MPVSLGIAVDTVGTHSIHVLCRLNNGLSLSGLCRLSTISLVLSAEEVNRTVSVRDSPEKIRAGSSSERNGVT